MVLAGRGLRRLAAPLLPSSALGRRFPSPRRPPVPRREPSSGASRPWAVSSRSQVGSNFPYSSRLCSVPSSSVENECRALRIMVELIQSLRVWIFRAQNLTGEFSNPRDSGPESETCAYFLLLLIVMLLTITTDICSSCHVPDAILSTLEVCDFKLRNTTTKWVVLLSPFFK